MRLVHDALKNMTRYTLIRWCIHVCSLLIVMIHTHCLTRAKKTLDVVSEALMHKNSCGSSVTSLQQELLKLIIRSFVQPLIHMIKKGVDRSPRKERDRNTNADNACLLSYFMSLYLCPAASHAGRL